MKLKVNNLFSASDKNKILVFSCLFMLFLSCKKENNLVTDFKSNFKKNATAISGLDYWSNNPYEWQVNHNKIECLVSKENSKLNLLKKQLGTENATVEINIRLGFFNDKISTLNKNWAGFHLGSSRSFLNDKKGLDIGLCTNGALFIGAPSLNHKNNIIINSLKNGVDLKILIKNNNQNKYTIDFSVLDIKKGQVLGRISKKNITPEQIIGDVALKSSFENSDENAFSNLKSVWFQDWEIKGSKIAMLYK